MFKNLAKLKIVLFVLVTGFFITKLDSFKQILFSYGVYSQAEDSHGVVLGSDENKNNTRSKESFRKKIGLAILNLGMTQDVTKEAFKINPNIALGLSIYSDKQTNLLNNCLQSRHQAMIYIPTQTIDSSNNDPGPLAMFIDDTAQENSQKFSNIASKTNENIGLYLEPQSIFSVEEDKASFLLKQLENINSNFKFFLYYDNEGSNFLTRLLDKSLIKNKAVVATTIIDETLSSGAIKYSLDSMIESKNTGIPFGIVVAPTKLTINTISTWLNENADKVEVVSVDEILKAQTAPQ